MSAPPKPEFDASATTTSLAASVGLAKSLVSSWFSDVDQAKPTSASDGKGASAGSKPTKQTRSGIGATTSATLQKAVADYASNASQRRLARDLALIDKAHVQGPGTEDGEDVGVSAPSKRRRPADDDDGDQSDDFDEEDSRSRVVAKMRIAAEAQLQQKQLGEAPGSKQKILPDGTVLSVAKRRRLRKKAAKEGRASTDGGAAPSEVAPVPTASTEKPVAEEEPTATQPAATQPAPVAANDATAENTDPWATNWSDASGAESDSDEESSPAAPTGNSRIRVQPLDLSRTRLPRELRPNLHAGDDRPEKDKNAKPAKSKRRSRQKNLKKDTRPDHQKPTYLTPGAADYRPILGPKKRADKASGPKDKKDNLKVFD
ncbi:hypothetical protein H696_02360 [Fonticula alba]|uniref:Uncharacterized protein n=1 Tax=Fonticula alba TaxID=691883 RepID=A0A058ZBW4_FONAL|nr:hypothetical protein H696_02360 [Fonticula alba]KCV71413.1 hypothetical protein H696_02360 [Fonticula alba]|eukprot:XP_009494536.1 hypothetical protein H696_02360 [Fonticula alba]